MLRLFKSNNPLNLFFLLLYAVVVRISLFFNEQAVEQFLYAPEIFSRWVFQFIHWINEGGGVVAAIVAILISYVQAVLISLLVQHFKLSEKQTYLPGMVYLLLSAIFPDFLGLSPALLSLTFVVILLYRLFASFSDDTSFVRVFDIGLMVAVASLFYFPMASLLVFTLFGLLSLRSFKPKEWLMLIAGFLNPYFLLWTYYFATDNLSELYTSILGSHFKSFSFNIELAWPYIALLSVLGILFLMSVFKFQARFNKSLIQIRKYYSLIYLLALVLFLSGLLAGKLLFAHFIVLAVPLAMLVSYAIRDVKRRNLAEIIHVILLAAVLLLQFKSI